MAGIKKYTVYYKTFKKGLKVTVDATNRGEAMRIVRDSVQIIRVDAVPSAAAVETPFSEVLKKTGFVSMTIRGWKSIFNKIKKLFVR
jgi:predicted nucleotidyltransferase